METMADVGTKAVAFRTLALLSGHVMGGYALSLFLIYWAVTTKVFAIIFSIQSGHPF